jgi:hypothetical protein
MKKKKNTLIAKRSDAGDFFSPSLKSFFALSGK